DFQDRWRQPEPAAQPGPRGEGTGSHTGQPRRATIGADLAGGNALCDAGDLGPERYGGRRGKAESDQIVMNIKAITPYSVDKS
ncbi:hypothetical protein, partial [Ralstonia pseudosolanacearum]